ncbi:anthranilate synthase component I family protein [Caldiplasma sukawensis]
MQKKLYNEIHKLKSNGEDFAYFCRFSGDQNSMGDEFLFTGGRVQQSEKIKDIDSMIELTPISINFPVIREIYGFDYSDEYPPILHMKDARVSRNSIIRNTVSLSGVKPNFREPYPELIKKILELRELIRRGEMLQAVISQEFGPISIDPEEIIRNYIENQKSMYVFYYSMEGMEILGSSPEMVVRRFENRVETEPIAGTRPMSENNEENRRLENELRNDEKELLEHRMLVDLARNDLGKIAKPGSVKVVQSMAIRHFSTVMHLVSKVEADLRSGVTNSSIVSAMVPAGTVSGAPKERAIFHINRLEDVSRGPYGGAIGIASMNSMDLALTIRSIYSRGGKYFTRAGAGIVKDSDPQRESKEIMAKAYSAAGEIIYGMPFH